MRRAELDYILTTMLGVDRQTETALTRRRKEVSDLNFTVGRPLQVEQDGELVPVITNPPLGMRVPIADLHGLLTDLFNVASKVLRPGGRLVLANPITLEKTPPSLQLQSRQAVDFGGFDCRVEKYIKL